MSFKEFKIAIKSIGFSSLEEFLKFARIDFEDALNWEKEDKVPYLVTFVLHTLRGDKDAVLDDLLSDCIPLATLSEDSSYFASKLEEMFLLQKQLNDSTNGKNWELGLNKFNKEIDWLRCIHMEAAELIDSTPWKHWKSINAKPDYNNIQVELVDIWHFLMSYVLQETNIAKAVSLASSYCIYEENSEINVKTLIKEVEKLSYLALAISTKNMPSFNAIDRFLEQFFIVCKRAGLSFSWLQKLYIGKNCLNQFRQDNGYKEGTYIKIWNENEDNVVMVELLKNMKDVSFDDLYKELDIKYKSL